MVQLTLKYKDGSPDFIVGVLDDDKAVDAWLEAARRESGWKQDTIIDRKVVVAENGVISEEQRASIDAHGYLCQTDWYIIRQIETGKECPPEIKKLRAEARLKVVK